MLGWYRQPSYIASVSHFQSWELQGNPPAMPSSTGKQGIIDHHHPLIRPSYNVSLGTLRCPSMIDECTSWYGIYTHGFARVSLVSMVVALASGLTLFPINRMVTKKQCSPSGLHESNLKGDDGYHPTWQPDPGPGSGNGDFPNAGRVSRVFACFFSDI